MLEVTSQGAIWWDCERSPMLVDVKADWSICRYHQMHFPCNGLATLGDLAILYVIGTVHLRDDDVVTWYLSTT
jgi:hypothetical protein